MVYSAVVTLVILYVIKAIVGLRASEDVEMVGLDISEHGMDAYPGEAAGVAH